MYMSRFSSAVALGRPCALALAFWIAGFGCLACCESGVPMARAPNQEDAARALDVAVGIQVSTHCAAHASTLESRDNADNVALHSSSAELFPRVGITPRFCGRAVQVADQARKPRLDANSQGSPAMWVLPLAQAGETQLPATTARTFIPDRRGTQILLAATAAKAQVARR
jgi:hypothetical protein